MHRRQYQSKTAAAFTFKLKAKTWCVLVALITALAFLALTSAAATHYHSTAQESHECSICCAIADKVGGNSVVPSILIAHFFVLFALAIQTLTSNFYSTPQLLPPGCGPPGIV